MALASIQPGGARPVLGDLIGPDAGVARLLKQAALLVAGVAAMWISAKVQLGTVPVPITLQVLVTMVIGAAYGPVLGMATIAAYLGLGAEGLPVFAGTPEKGIGMAYMMGPTGGYLLGFLLAAGTVGALARAGWDRSVASMAGAMAIGLVVMYVPGVVWLCAGLSLFGTVAAGAGAEVFAGYGWENWYSYGVRTFLWVDALKLVVAVLAFPAIWRLVGDARV